MVDTRFHRFAGPVAVGALLAQIGRGDLAETIEQAGQVIAGAAELDLAEAGDVALAAQSSYAEILRRTNAGVVIVSPALRDLVPAGSIAVTAAKPHEVFAGILDVLYPSSTKSIIAGARDELGPPIYERDVILGANVVIGAGVEIGRGTVIGANSVIGAGVTIGRNCVIAANCTIDCAHLGNEVIIHSGVRIGTEGFGWLDLGQSNRKIPQLGRVIIQDRVEIGANSTIDRGALGDTVLGDGTKVDNLVQIGHNCRIGRNCLIAAMSGLSGSTIVGDGVLMGGGVGTSGHLTIGGGSVIHGRAAVTKDWPPGSKLAGAPAQDIRDFWRELAVLRKLSKGEKRG
ncbi:UDP-3-O-(3-hydroxymyristoyl)glucosamine N-acyltransferase [Devosia sp. YIM 151766]|uniref:UDP-3-O-(3-hydroxymyristoyl)glucosamine N-acyltransferase n=1 Tax=Devosia sp. YIM 151766 TaxID=3017325 RepID=UPI00255CC24E|nr:UDP-3-O-(3-hydroxymyristoyl)glucosamine N-acyltransferase [Devosia sp. YIM 151766]WIY54297.1 UDP-3-O-(3-hydroxymyristoyl)glucosamine N-acyltransferase [Devosia sp. YIM 151766]